MTVVKGTGKKARRFSAPPEESKPEDIKLVANGHDLMSLRLAMTRVLAMPNGAGKTFQIDLGANSGAISWEERVWMETVWLPLRKEFSPQVADIEFVSCGKTIKGKLR